jgi:glutamine amidotransferase
MCELFAMSSRLPTSIGLSLEQLAMHGGAEGPHKDGWGIALFEDRDAFLFREPGAASTSELERFIQGHAPPSSLVIAHIRMATRGDVSLRNTQPFQRELGGRSHIFAHNGDLDGMEGHPELSCTRFLPIGDSDSELAFCFLLERLAGLWKGGSSRLPALSARLDLISAFAAELRPFGPANFLYSDSDALFVHAHRRTQGDGEIAPPGLHLLERTCHESRSGLQGTGVQLTTVDQRLTLVASLPLTPEEWQPLGEGEVLAIRQGQIVARVTPRA